jgi:hypothetical protein
MKIKAILLMLLLLGTFGSCSKILEPFPNGDRSGDDLWEYQDMVQGLIGMCYDNIPRNYNNDEGVYLDGATDDAVITSSTYRLRRLGNGTLTTTQDPFLTYWSRNYQSIYRINKYLEGRKGFNVRLLVDLHQDSILRHRLLGEAFALRAWFQWDLLQKFGGKAINGEYLGFPIILEPVIENVNLARNTYAECIKQIMDDCDSAFKYLPLAHRDFLVPDVNDRVHQGGKLWGRFDRISLVAMKAMIYLTWASPRFNPGNDISRWDSAAVNAKRVIDFKLNVDGKVPNGFNPVNAVNWFSPNFQGIVYGTRYHSTANDYMERMFYPGGFQGNGEIGATQELVDAFPMKNGYPVNDPDNRGGYDPTKPYVNRDPRFYSTIFYNTVQAKKNNTGALMYTFENWANGGKDAAGVASNNSLTNYHIKKMVYMGLNWSDASIGRMPHSKFIYRWTHMCLIFAEAANHVVGPADNAKYGMSAKTAIQYLRARKTPDGANGLSPTVPSASDAYLTEVANAGQTAFDELVKNERRIETCFEGMRFYDLRRWTTSLTELNKAVHGVYIEKNADDTFTYDFNYEVEKRSFTSAYLPIPYAEMLRASKLIQNEGWDSWN